MMLFFLFLFSAITWKMHLRSLLILCLNYLEVKFLMENCVPFAHSFWFLTMHLD